MKHLGTKPLETDRLLLRAFIPEDASAMYQNWASDPEVTKYLTWPAHEPEAVTAQMIATWIAQYQDPKYYQWAILWKKSMEPIGSISVVEMDESILEATVGYCIGRPWWHQDVMTECFSAVIRYLFEEVGFNRITANHDINNPHSGMVMKKCGLRYEGTHRQASRNNQGICNSSIYAILQEDYKKQYHG